MPEEKRPAKAVAKEKPTAGATKTKKAKPPALEDKPFQEFMTQHFVPSLQESLASEGISDLALSFNKKSLPIQGLEESQLWQVEGQWKQGQRQFLIAFQHENIKGPKFYAAADNGSQPTLLESFMIDEKRITLGLMVMYVVQRLNAQKWLTGN